MGSEGIIIAESKDVNLMPITGTVTQFNSALRSGEIQPDHEIGALFTAEGEPIVGYGGDKHSIPVDSRVLNVEGGIFTHYHPSKAFGGTLSMADLGVFAQSKLGELQAVSSQGQLYSVKAGANADREGLAKWVRQKGSLAQRNFERSYKSALKQATTPLKSGPHKGQIKLVNRTTGKVTYREPMTLVQAVNYARTYSVGMFDRMYSKALSKFGITYTATKAGVRK